MGGVLKRASSEEGLEISHRMDAAGFFRRKALQGGGGGLADIHAQRADRLRILAALAELKARFNKGSPEKRVEARMRRGVRPRPY
jgi:hypothetical protein